MKVKLAQHATSRIRNMPSSGTLAHESSNAMDAYSFSSESADVSDDNYEPEVLTSEQSRFNLPSLVPSHHIIEASECHSRD